MTKISVVIPMYNSGPWVEFTFDSVLAQSFPRDRVEIIIVDDGSTDNSVALATAFMKRHGYRGEVITQKNGGASSARNRGWRAATSEWIQFLDSDDLLSPEKMALQAALIPAISDDVALICSSWQRLGLEGETWLPVGPIMCPELRDPVVVRLVSLNAGFLGPALIRRSALDLVGGFSEEIRYADDEHLYLKFARARLTFVEAPSDAPTFFIRQTPGSKSRGSIAKLARQHLENVIAAEEILREQRGGALLPTDRKELSAQCDWSLSELHEHDRASFRQYWKWIRELDPSYAPQHSFKLRLVTRAVGYENAERIAQSYRSSKAALRRLKNLLKLKRTPLDLASAPVHKRTAGT